MYRPAKHNRVATAMGKFGLSQEDIHKLMNENRNIVNKLVLSSKNKKELWRKLSGIPLTFYADNHKYLDPLKINAPHLHEELRQRYRNAYSGFSNLGARTQTPGELFKKLQADGKLGLRDQHGNLLIKNKTKFSATEFLEEEAKRRISSESVESNPAFNNCKLKQIIIPCLIAAVFCMVMMKLLKR